MRSSTINFGLGLCLPAVWGPFRLLRGNEPGRCEQGDCSLTEFLDDVPPGNVAALLFDLGAAQRPPRRLLP